MRLLCWVGSLLLLLGPVLAAGQSLGEASGPWVMERSGTTAGLRGIHAVGGGVAWASGTNGTVLRTEDGGYEWQSCAMPPGAEKLDFRGIWAWDDQTAIVMSSGTGGASRIYKTTDGCSSWKLVFTNPDKDGFWDALLFVDQKEGVVLGDPARGNWPQQASYAFFIRATNDGGKTWIPVGDPEKPIPGVNLQSFPGEAFFAASNSSMTVAGRYLLLGTSKNRVLRKQISNGKYWNAFNPPGCSDQVDPNSPSCGMGWGHWQIGSVPLANTSATSGIFSLAFRDERHGVAVGGDYTKPNDSDGTAAWSVDGGKTWTAAEKPPHGYRSAVAWDAVAKAWIAAGTNGSDVSYDDGKTWVPLDDGNWNALSLPWVVGPNGRIAKLDADKLPRK